MFMEGNYKSTCKFCFNKILEISEEIHKLLEAKIPYYLLGSGDDRTIRLIRYAKSNLDDHQRKGEDYHKTTWNTRKKFIEEWFMIGERNQQIINDIIQDS